MQQYSIEDSFRVILEHWLGAEQARGEAQRLWNEFRPFWESHFFVDRHLRHDLPYPGAVQFVNRIKDAGHSIVYLTGRDRPRSGVGTLLTLRSAGFPLDHDDLLMMKAEKAESDVVYKTRAAAELNQRFDVRVLVDNEPENLVAFAEKIPSAEIVFFHSVMSERVPHGNFKRLLGARKAWRLLSYEFEENPSEELF